jgi:hypothetical protein
MNDNATIARIISDLHPFAADHPVTDARGDIWATPADVPANWKPTARYIVRWELERCADWTGRIGEAARRILRAHPYPAFATGSASEYALA